MLEERDHHLLLTDEMQTALLVGRSHGRIELLHGRGRPGAVGALEAAATFSLDVPYLRCAGLLRDESGTPFAALHELDVPPRGWAPPAGTSWLSLGEADPESLGPPEWARAIARWLGEQQGAPIPANRAPWARPGWFASATSWMTERAADAGLEPVGRVELEQQWPLSSVLRVDTAGGRVFFKGVFQLFHHEPGLSVALAERHPELLPEIVAVDAVRGWMLMRELSGELLGDTVVERWSEGLRLLGRVQRAWAGHEPDLIALGAHDRSLGALAHELPDVPDAVELAAEERARVERAVPELERMCEDVAAGPLPQTLVHGDFHPWNVMLDGTGLRIFDWSDACVAHPLFDLPTFLRRTDDQAARRAMLDSYGEDWADVASVAELRALVGIAEPLAHVHHAVSYLRILDALEPEDRWYFAAEPRRWILGATDLVEAMR